MMKQIKKLNQDQKKYIIEHVGKMMDKEICEELNITLGSLQYNKKVLKVERRVIPAKKQEPMGDMFSWRHFANTDRILFKF